MSKSKYEKPTLEFISQNNENNEIENNVLITQLMVTIYKIGLRTNKNTNNCVKIKVENKYEEETI